MKKLQRPIILLLVTALILSAFAGCKSNNNEDLLNQGDKVVTSTFTTVTGGGVDDTLVGNKGSTTVKTEEVWGGAKDWQGAVIDDKTVLNYDFGGKTIIIDGMPKPDATASKSQAAHDKVFGKLEAMNCKVKFVARSFTATKEAAVLNTMSDTYFADIVMGPQHGVVGYLTSDMLLDLSKLKTIDLSKAYMNVGDGVNAFHLGSGYWAVNYPYELAQLGNYVLFNKRIMKEVTGDENHPYKLMKNGKWNLTSLKELQKKGTKELNGDGQMTADDQWGLLTIDYGTSGSAAVLQANRALMIRNVNGMLAYNMEDGKCIPSINTAVELFDKKNGCLNIADKATEFSSGHGLFLAGAFAEHTRIIADMKDDYGVVPFPLGEGQTEYSSPANWNTDTMAIPVCIGKDRKAAAGAFLQAYMLLCDEELISAYFDELTLRYCRDEESKENLMIGYRAQTTPPANAVANDDAIKMGTFRVCYESFKGTASPATLVAQNKSISINAINDLNEKLK